MSKRNIDMRKPTRQAYRRAFTESLIHVYEQNHDTLSITRPQVHQYRENNHSVNDISKPSPLVINAIKLQTIYRILTQMDIHTFSQDPFVIHTKRMIANLWRAITTENVFNRYNEVLPKEADKPKYPSQRNRNNSFFYCTKILLFIEPKLFQIIQSNRVAMRQSQQPTSTKPSKPSKRKQAQHTQKDATQHDNATKTSKAKHTSASSHESINLIFLKELSTVCELDIAGITAVEEFQPAKGHLEPPAAISTAEIVRAFHGEPNENRNEANFYWDQIKAEELTDLNESQAPKQAQLPSRLNSQPDSTKAETHVIKPLDNIKAATKDQVINDIADFFNFT